MVRREPADPLRPPHRRLESFVDASRPDDGGPVRSQLGMPEQAQGQDRVGNQAVDRDTAKGRGRNWQPFAPLLTGERPADRGASHDLDPEADKVRQGRRVNRQVERRWKHEVAATAEPAGWRESVERGLHPCPEVHHGRRLVWSLTGHTVALRQLRVTSET